MQSVPANETTEPPSVSSERNLLNLVDMRYIAQSLLATCLPNETSSITAPTLQSIHSYIRVLVPERYARELLSAVEKIFSSSTNEVLQGCINLLILLCSNNFISDQQTYQMASLAYAGGAGDLLMSIFSIPTPTVAEFANHLFRGAVEAEDLEIVRLMIHGTAHWNLRSALSKRRPTPLEFAVARGNIGLVKILLEAGASPNDRMQLECEQLSISREATIQRDLNGNEHRTEDVKNRFNRKTARKDHTNANLDLVHSPENSGKDHVSTSKAATPFDAAVPEDLERSSTGCSEAKLAPTPLHIVSRERSLDNFQVHEAGADINASSALHSGMTALQAASSAGRLDVIEVLLNAGADVNASPASHSGMTALQAASIAGSQAVVSLLLGAGADFRSSAEVPPRKTALQIAVEYGNIEIVETLLDVVARDYSLFSPKDGEILLRIAASNGHLGIVCLLLDNVISCEANVVLPYLETVIEAAAEHGRLDTIHLLCSLYRGVAGPGARFKTAGALAIQNGHYTVAKLLSTYNTDEC